MTFIALTGHGRVGKDTIADILVEECGYTKLSVSEDLLWPIYVEMSAGSPDGRIPFSYQQLHHRVRGRMQDLQGILRRVLFDDVLAEAMLRRWFQHPDGDFVLCNMRSMAEAVSFTNAGAITCRVTRESVWAPINSHPIERELEDFSTALTISNDDSLEELRDTVVDFLSPLAKAMTK